MGCFRYSLGRRTYMPSHTVAMIKNNKEIFRKFDWEQIIREIKDTDDHGNIGDACDGDTWRELVDFCRLQLNTLTEH